MAEDVSSYLVSEKKEELEDQSRSSVWMKMTPVGVEPTTLNHNHDNEPTWIEPTTMTGCSIQTTNSSHITHKLHHQSLNVETNPPGVFN